VNSLVGGVVAAVVAATGAPEPAPAKRAPLVSDRGVKAARAFAQGREGFVSFAVIGTKGKVRGYDRARTYPAASVTKAMLMVEVLRRAEGRSLSTAETDLLYPMITRSANQPARDLFSLVGSPGLYAVAEAAKMRDFSSANSLFESQISAEDQARFFVKLGGLVPRRHRSYARGLLKSVIPAHRWGIPPAARERRLTPFIKGGWRSDVVHQVALLEKSRKRRIALAVLSDTTNQGYGRATIEGVARRVLDPPGDRLRGDRARARRRAQ